MAHRKLAPLGRPTYPAPSTVQGLEPLLTMNEVAVIYGLSTGTIRRDLQRGTFQPEPWDKYPYRWKRSDIQADLDTNRKLRKRQHGRYAKQAKATTGNGHVKRAAVDRRRRRG